MPIHSKRNSISQSANAVQQKRNHITQTTRVLIDRAIAHTVENVRVLPSKFYWWVRTRSGIRCTCTRIEDEEEYYSQCPVCFGSGFVSGYDKHGCNTITALYSGEETVGVGVRWLFELQKELTTLGLDDDSVYGELYTQYYPIQRGKGLEMVYVKCEGDVTVYGQMQAHGDTWYDVTGEDFAELINTGAALRLKAVLRRESVDAPTPELACVKIRYQLAEEIAVRGDIPAFSFSEVRDMHELMFPQLDSYTLHVNGEVSLEIGDVVEHLETRIRFKVISLDTITRYENRVLGMNATVRRIQPDDPVRNIQ